MRAYLENTPSRSSDTPNRGETLGRATPSRDMRSPSVWFATRLHPSSMASSQKTLHSNTSRAVSSSRKTNSCNPLAIATARKTSSTRRFAASIFINVNRRTTAKRPRATTCFWEIASNSSRRSGATSGRWVSGKCLTCLHGRARCKRTRRSGKTCRSDRAACKARCQKSWNREGRVM